MAFRNHYPAIASTPWCTEDNGWYDDSSGHKQFCRNGVEAAGWELPKGATVCLVFTQSETAGASTTSLNFLSMGGAYAMRELKPVLPDVPLWWWPEILTEEEEE